MFGDNILVSPKLNEATDVLKTQWVVWTTLPTAAKWYNLNTQMLDPRTSRFEVSYNYN